jgi:hypothetical protein
MFGWLTRVLLIAAGAVASWFTARDAPNFSVVQGIVAMLLLALTVGVIGFWPKAWSAWLNRASRSRG